MEKLNDIQRKILRILYAWGLNYFDKFMPKNELISRLGKSDIDHDIFDLRNKNMIEIVPDNEEWRGVRITPNGIQILRIFDIL